MVLFGLAKFGSAAARTSVDFLKLRSFAAIVDLRSVLIHFGAAVWLCTKNRTARIRGTSATGVKL